MTDRMLLGDREVARLGFGAMRLAAGDGDRAVGVLRRAVELGLEVVDTADVYGGDGANERLVADALHPYPPHVVVATKGGLLGGGAVDGRPAHLRAACEASLGRLRVDAVDLYYLHAPDTKVPFEESVGALEELRREGKIRRIGLSNVTVAQVERARQVTAVAAVQNRYSVVDRAHESVLAYCEQKRIAFVPWRPLGGAVLTGPAHTLPQLPEPQRRARRRVHDLAVDLDVTPAQVAIAWLLARSPAVLPIPGTSSLTHLEQLAAARRLELTPAQMASLG